AVAIKPSVYVMPLSEQSREDFSWTLKEIIDGGGDGSISEARFVEGLTDEQIITLFQNARKSEYEKIIQETRNLLADWSSEQNHSIDPAVKGPVQLSKMQRRVDEIAAIDFFQTPERATAEILLKELEKILSGYPIEGKTLEKVHSDLKGKIWVTRENLFVDRIACGWLIRKFIDQEAVFKFVSEPQYSPKPDEILFDMFDGEYTHEGDRCTFEVMIQRLQPKDNALGPLGKVVHDIDLKDGKYARSETDGFNALLTGLVAAYSDDDQRMTEGYRLFDNLYTYYQRQKKE
ncbi:MAG: chromate resistance protein, partial [Deltaproteobacteria bacterium]|nr:chromate resistance protein [Deltaproteobacteria bacterium]